MASTYSDLKIELIGTGDQSGTWGATTNTNLGTALEEAIVGRATANFTSDADLTITLSNVNTTQVARNYILNVTSAVALTVTRSLIVPTIDKPYIIENNTTGGQSILVKTSAGTGITVPTGKTVMVYANGTNVVQAFDYVPSVTVGTVNITSLTAGSITDSGLTAGRVTYAGTAGLLADSASLTFDGTILSTTTVDATNLEVTNIKAKDGTAAGSIANSTGVVTIASSVLTTTDINGGTIDATAIGGSTPSTVAATTISGTDLTTTGNTILGNASTDTLNVGNGDLVKDSSGNVGIGTTSPSTKLDVNGNLTVATTSFNTKFTNPIGNGGIAFNASTDPTTVDQRIFSLGFGSLTYNAQARLEAYSAEAWTATNRGSYLRFSTTPIASTTPAERMRIDSAGNVGIGTASPTAKLDVVGTIKSTTYSTFDNGTSLSSITAVNTGGSLVLAIDNSAGSGFGLAYSTNLYSTANTNFRIWVNGGVRYTLNPAGDSTTTGSSTSTSFIPSSSTVPTNGLYLPAANNIGFSTNTTERMRLDSSGNLGLGITPSAWGGGFAVSQYKGGAIGSQNSSYLYTAQNGYYDGTNWKYITSNFASISEQVAGKHIWSNAASGTAGNNITFTNAMTLDTSGNLGIGTASPAAKLDVASGNIKLTDTYSLVWGSAATYISGNSATPLMTFTVNSAERMRLDSSGNLGLGVTPSAWSGAAGAAIQSVNGNFAGNSQLNLTANAYYNSGFKYVGTGNATYFYTDTTGAFKWYSAPSGTAGNAITFTQVLAVEKDKSLALQGATSASGAGITFPATQSASSDANTLDDYEEGTWTGAITTSGGSVTIGSQTCTYVKVGRLVVLNGNISVSAISSPTGQCTITGLPFTPASSVVGGSTVMLANANTTTATAVYSEISNTPRIYIAKSTVLSSIADAADLIGATTVIRFSATYQI